MKNLGINKCLEYIIDRDELSSINIKSYLKNEKEKINVIKYINPKYGRGVYCIITQRDDALSDELFDFFRTRVEKGSNLYLINLIPGFPIAGAFNVLKEMDDMLEEDRLNDFFAIVQKEILDTMKDHPERVIHKETAEKTEIKEKFFEFNKIFSQFDRSN